MDVFLFSPCLPGSPSFKYTEQPPAQSTCLIDLKAALITGPVDMLALIKVYLSSVSFPQILVDGQLAVLG